MTGPGLPFPFPTVEAHSGFNQAIAAADEALGAAMELVNYFYGEGPDPMDEDVFEALPLRARAMVDRLAEKLQVLRPEPERGVPLL